MSVRPSVRPTSVHRTSIRPSMCPSIFHFRMITSKHQWIFTKLGMCIDIVEIWFWIANGQIRVNINGFSPNLVCALILWRSGLGLLTSKFCQIFMELSAQDTPIFLFPDNNLRKLQGILTKLDVCIDIKEIWFGIANGQKLSNFYRVICPRHAHIFVSRQ